MIISFDTGTSGTRAIEEGADFVVLFNGNVDRFERNDRHTAPFTIFDLGFGFPFGTPCGVGSHCVIDAVFTVGIAVECQMIVAVFFVADKDFSVVTGRPFILGGNFICFKRSGTADGAETDIKSFSVVDDLYFRRIFMEFFGIFHYGHGFDLVRLCPDTGIKVESGEGADIRFGHFGFGSDSCRRLFEPGFKGCSEQFELLCRTGIFDRFGGLCQGFMARLGQTLADHIMAHIIAVIVIECRRSGVIHPAVPEQFEKLLNSGGTFPVGALDVFVAQFIRILFRVPEEHIDRPEFRTCHVEKVMFREIAFVAFRIPSAVAAVGEFGIDHADTVFVDMAQIDGGDTADGTERFPHTVIVFPPHQSGAHFGIFIGAFEPFFVGRSEERLLVIADIGTETDRDVLFYRYLRRNGGEEVTEALDAEAGTFLCHCPGNLIQKHEEQR